MSGLCEGCCGMSGYRPQADGRSDGSGLESLRRDTRYDLIRLKDILDALTIMVGVGPIYW